MEKGGINGVEDVERCEKIKDKQSKAPVLAKNLSVITSENHKQEQGRGTANSNSSSEQTATPTKASVMDMPI